MQPVQLKLITIICEPILTQNIVTLSKSLGASGFTITDVRGEGSGEKSAGEIPEEKTKIEIIVKPQVSEKIMTGLEEKYFQNYSIIVFSTDAIGMRSGKF